MPADQRLCDRRPIPTAGRDDDRDDDDDRAARGATTTG
jgi:hypothetical protein